MPELPEVEVSRLGVTPHLKGKTIQRILVRQPRLRWPVAEELNRLSGQQIHAISRRAKYLLLELDSGAVIIHLGMSGSLRVLPQGHPPGRHDHVDLLLSDGMLLRYHDPRRFGAWLWQPAGEQHPLLQQLGPEPLEAEFSPEYMQGKSRGKRSAVKSFIMDNKVVVGVGNIYANESLFAARIHPQTSAGTLTSAQWQLLVTEIKRVLAVAITQGGTTLKDFSQADGRPGYFAQQLHVYGRAGEPCPACGEPIAQLKVGQRNSFFCPHCQPKP